MEALTLQTEEIMIWDKEEDQIDGVRIKQNKTKQKKNPSEPGSGYEGRKGKRAEHVVLRTQTSKAPDWGAGCTAAHVG